MQRHLTIYECILSIKRRKNRYCHLYYDKKENKREQMRGKKRREIVCVCEFFGFPLLRSFPLDPDRLNV